MKIFVSYTMRDGKVTKKYLEKLQKQLELKYGFCSEIYIDILHNPYRYDGSVKSEDSLAHRHVEHMLKGADMILAVSPADSSPWVALELGFAKELGIRIVSIMCLSEPLADAA